MDFSAAIIAHAQWRTRLEHVIDGRQEVDIAATRRDDVCPLGQWLHDPAMRGSTPPEVHRHVLELHARFHEVAAQVAEAATTGAVAQARAELALEGEFSRVSTAVMLALSALVDGDPLRSLHVEIVGPPPARVVDDHPNPYRHGRYIALALVLGVVAVGLVSAFVLSGVGAVVFSLVAGVALGALVFVLVKNLLILPLVEPAHGIAERLHLGELPQGAVTWTLATRVNEHTDAVEYRQLLTTGLVAATAANVAAIATQLAEQLASVTDVSDTVTTATSDISTNVSSISTSVDELSGAIREVSQGVESAATLSASVRASMTSTSRHVSDLDEAAQCVNDVVHLIEAIASQTDMLALNATIEAARAGDLGKGFAVVAGEVKGLAGETSSATQDIGDRIGQIRTVSAAMTEVFGSLEADITALDEQEGMMAAMATEQSSAVATIAQRVIDASATLREVSERMGGVNGAVRAARELAAESRTTAQHLTELVSAMGSSAS